MCVVHGRCSGRRAQQVLPLKNVAHRTGVSYCRAACVVVAPGLATAALCGRATRVAAISYCRDVTAAAGETHQFWERIGDRADVIFSSPDEIGALVKTACSKDL